MNVSDILKEKGIKKSGLRIAILSALQKKNVPLTEEQIKQDIKIQYESPAFTQTLQLFVNVDIIARIVVEGQPLRYMLNEVKPETSSVHFFCRRCHKFIPLKSVTPQLHILPSGYEQEACDVIIKGICPDCQ